MRTTPKQVTDVHAKGSDVGSSFARNPENAHISLFIVLNELGLVDSPHSEFLFDGRNEGRSLEAGSIERLKCLLQLLDFVNSSVQFHHCDVLFTRRLLRFDQSGSIVDADNEAAGNLGIERSWVTRLVNLEDFLDPGDNLVRWGIWRLVKVDYTVALEHVDGARSGRIAAREGSKMWCFYVKLVKILVEQIRNSKGQASFVK